MFHHLSWSTENIIAYRTFLIWTALSGTGCVGGCWFWSCCCCCCCWCCSSCGVIVAGDSALPVAARLPRGAVQVRLAVRALAVGARVALGIPGAVVRCTSFLAIVASHCWVVVAHGTNRNCVPEEDISLSLFVCSTCNQTEVFRRGSCQGWCCRGDIASNTGPRDCTPSRDHSLHIVGLKSRFTTSPYSWTW